MVLAAVVSFPPAAASGLTITEVPSNLYTLRKEADLVAVVSITGITYASAGRVLALDVHEVYAGTSQPTLEVLVDERSHFGRHYTVGGHLLAMLATTSGTPGHVLRWPPFGIPVEEQAAIADILENGARADLAALATPAAHRAALAWGLDQAPPEEQEDILFSAADQLFVSPDDGLLHDLIEASTDLLPVGDRANLLLPFAESFARIDTGIAVYSAFAESPAHTWMVEESLLDTILVAWEADGRGC